MGNVDAWAATGELNAAVFLRNAEEQLACRAQSSPERFATSMKQSKRGYVKDVHRLTAASPRVSKSRTEWELAAISMLGLFNQLLLLVYKSGASDSG
jgi:hypothetical protein